jgi:acyl-CoA thioester hydrolase
MPDAFSHTFRVRYAEVDLQSVVFNSRYLEYADLIITEYWRTIGLHFAGEEALEFHVVRAEVDFTQPIRADEMVEGRAVTTRIGSSSVTTQIDLLGAEGRDQRAQIVLVHVHVDLETGKPIPIPDAARAVLQPDES